MQFVMGLDLVEENGRLCCGFHYLLQLLRLNVYCPRSTRQSPSLPQGSTSTSYRASTNKAQLINKMPNFSEMKEENEELNYKV